MSAVHDGVAMMRFCPTPAADAAGRGGGIEIGGRALYAHSGDGWYWWGSCANGAGRYGWGATR